MASGSYWCYSCNRFVWVSSNTSTEEAPRASLSPPPTRPSLVAAPTALVLRGSDASEAYDRSAFHMYYDDGSDSGLRPLPPSMTEFLLGSGFDRLHVIEIDRIHLESDSQSHCAVCKESFELKSSAKEMPCNHIYHPDCILPLQ
ncbi:unnamed protein product [Brassica rapa subsp. trilocularis]